MQDRNSRNVKIIDVSHWQGVIDFAKVKADGVVGVYIKLTEGVGYIDDMALRNYTEAKKAGLLVGFYHYAHADNDPAAEAKHFLDVVGGRATDLPHVLDLEETKARTPGQITAFAQKWLAAVGGKPMIYSGAAFASKNFGKALGAYPLWVARYSSSNPAGGMRNPGASNVWSRWAMFQYTSSGCVAGIAGRCDLNEMDLAFFDALFPAKVAAEVDDCKYRLMTGAFPNAEALAEAKAKLSAKHPWLLYEKADSVDFNPTYRLVTGTFTGKQTAEQMAADLRKEFGWTIYVKEA